MATKSMTAREFFYGRDAEEARLHLQLAILDAAIEALERDPKAALIAMGRPDLAAETASSMEDRLARVRAAQALAVTKRG